MLPGCIIEFRCYKAKNKAKFCGRAECTRAFSLGNAVGSQPYPCQVIKDIHPLAYKALLAFLPQKGEVENALLHVFRSFVSPCGSAPCAIQRPGKFQRQMMLTFCAAVDKELPQYFFCTF